MMGISEEMEHQTSPEKRLQHQLEVQSMQIERVFSHHELEARVSGGQVQSRSIQYNLQMSLAAGWEKLRQLKQDLVHALGAVDVQFTQQAGQWQLHVGQPNKPFVSLLDLLNLLSDIPPMTATLGLAEDGCPILLTLAEGAISHVLISGELGAGKTTLLRTIAVSLAMSNRQSQLQLIVMGHDAAYSELEPLNYLPHMLNPVVYSPVDAEALLTKLGKELAYRQQQHVAKPTIVILIDEVVWLLQQGNTAVREAITQLLQLGEQVGIHLLVTSEQLDAVELDAIVKGNLPIRLVGRLQDERLARIASGLPDSQADFLLGQGDFLAVSDGERIHFQAAYVGDYDLHMCLNELHRQRKATILARPYAARVSLEEDGVEGEQRFDLNDDGVQWH